MTVNRLIVRPSHIRPIARRSFGASICLGGEPFYDRADNHGNGAQRMSATDQAAPAVLPRTEWLARADRLLVRGLEHLTALLVVAEIVILFVGIVARYAFH